MLALMRGVTARQPRIKEGSELPKSFNSDAIENDVKIIDAKLPLPWLIGSACAIVFSMGGVFVKLDAVGSAVLKIEAKTDNRDERISTLTQSILQHQGRNEVQDTQIHGIQNEVRDLKRDVEEIKKSQRWVPK